jgi:hypothetical protein
VSWVPTISDNEVVSEKSQLSRAPKVKRVLLKWLGIGVLLISHNCMVYADGTFQLFNKSL